jgi:hypothetical protein
VLFRRPGANSLLVLPGSATGEAPNVQSKLHLMDAIAVALGRLRDDSGPDYLVVQQSVETTAALVLARDVLGDHATRAEGGLHARQHETVGAGAYEIDLIAMRLFLGVGGLAGRQLEAELHTA